MLLLMYQDSEDMEQSTDLCSLSIMLTVRLDKAWLLLPLIKSKWPDQTVCMCRQIVHLHRSLFMEHWSNDIGGYA